MPLPSKIAFSHLSLLEPEAFKQYIPVTKQEKFPRTDKRTGMFICNTIRDTLSVNFDLAYYLGKHFAIFQKYHI